jgi:tetratricopeptide (TPR) repeat protein
MADTDEIRISNNFKERAMFSGDAGSTSGNGWQAGKELLAAGKTGEAIEALQQFIQNNGQNFEAHNYLGVALGQAGRYDEAVAALQRAIRLHPQSAVTHFNLGVVYEKMQRTKDARKEYEAAIQLDPRHTSAQLALARLDSGIGSTPGAGASVATAPMTTASDSAAPWASGSAATEQLGADQLAHRAQMAKPHVLNILGGFGAGFVAAIICAILWDKLSYYTGYQFGYAAIGVGFVVGWAVVFGAGKKYGIALQVIGALMALFGILLGQTLLVMDYLRDEIAKDPTMAAQNVSGLELFFGSMIFLPEFMKESPMSALFGLLGLWVGWTTPAVPKDEGEFPEATATDAPAPAAASAVAVTDAPPPSPLSTPDASAPDRK